MHFSQNQRSGRHFQRITPSCLLRHLVHLSVSTTAAGRLNQRMPNRSNFIYTWEVRQALTSKGTENWVECERDSRGRFISPNPRRWFTLWDTITSVTFPFNWVTNDSHFWGKGHSLTQVKVFSVLYFSGRSGEGAGQPAEPSRAWHDIYM